MKLVAIGLGLVLSAGLAQAQQSCQVIGNQVYCSGGNYAGSQNIGNQTYYNYNNQRSREVLFKFTDGASAQAALESLNAEQTAICANRLARIK